MKQQIREVLHAHDDERRRIAVVLHESIGQSLAALAATLDLIARDAHGAPDSGLLNEGRMMARQAFRQLRAVTDQLFPPLLGEVGLTRAVQSAVTDFAERTGIDVVHRFDECPRLPTSIESALYRVIDASLNSLEPGLLQRGAPSVTLAAAGGALRLIVEPLRIEFVEQWRRRLRLQFGDALHVTRVTLPTPSLAAGAAPPAARLVLTVAGSFL